MPEVAQEKEREKKEREGKKRAKNGSHLIAFLKPEGATEISTPRRESAAHTFGAGKRQRKKKRSRVGRAIR